RRDKGQLLEGGNVEKTPQKAPHMTSLRLVDRALNRLFCEGYDVRTQRPLAVGGGTGPQPEGAVVVGSPRDYFHAHPNRALLIVEIAESSLRADRRKKAPVYARASIPEYWIVNLEDRCVEVHRDPTFGAPLQMEPQYASVTKYGPGESIA